ncbi:MAG: hypothetical protein U0T75_12495 [Chitinophagales bacterium]
MASELASPVSYSSIHLYFSEPKGKAVSSLNAWEPIAPSPTLNPVFMNVDGQWCK